MIVDSAMGEGQISLEGKGKERNKEFGLDTWKYSCPDPNLLAGHTER
jgi:hypothetical protein